MKKFLKLYSMSPNAILFLKEFSFVLGNKKQKQVKKIKINSGTEALTSNC